MTIDDRAVNHTLSLSRRYYQDSAAFLPCYWLKEYWCITACSWNVHASPSPYGRNGLRCILPAGGQRYFSRREQLWRVIVTRRPARLRQDGG
ncbi:hypothetical protein GQ600_17618 [Phytophthora cactorum]|nr:hypothetical protein GQ600_17618 [Phytophthora cactorum]